MRGMTNYSDMKDGAAASLGLSRPLSVGHLFWSFSALSLQGFGGVVAVAQRELVERRRWLTPEQFAEDWAVAQLLPGANVVNLSLMLGDRYFGWRGSLSALAGMLTFPVLIVLALALLYARVSDLPAVQGALRGMGAVAAGMIAATAIKMFQTLKKNVLPTRFRWALIALCFVAIAVFRVRLIWVLLGLGGVAAALAYRWLGQRGEPGAGQSDGPHAGKNAGAARVAEPDRGRAAARPGAGQ